MKKISRLIACTRNHFDFWNSCEHLQNFVNVEAVLARKITNSADPDQLAYEECVKTKNDILRRNLTPIKN